MDNASNMKTKSIHKLTKRYDVQFAHLVVGASWLHPIENYMLDMKRDINKIGAVGKKEVMRIVSERIREFDKLNYNGIIRKFCKEVTEKLHPY